MIRPNENLKQSICEYFPAVKSEFKWLFIFLHNGPQFNESHFEKLWKLLKVNSVEAQKYSKTSAINLLNNNLVPVDQLLKNGRKRPASPLANSEPTKKVAVKKISAISSKCLKLLPMSNTIVSFYFRYHSHKTVQASPAMIQARPEPMKHIPNDEVIVLDDEEEHEQSKEEEKSNFEPDYQPPITLATTICTQPVFEDKPFLLNYQSINLTDEEIFCLQPLTFVNDNLINFYLRYLYAERLTESQKTQTYFFNCFFYTRLSQTLQVVAPIPKQTNSDNLLKLVVSEVSQTLVPVTTTTTNNQVSVISAPLITNNNQVAVVSTPVIATFESVVSVTKPTTAQSGSDRVLRSSGLPAPSPHVIISVPDLPQSLDEKKILHSKIATWTKKVDIFERDFVIIPINEK
ncbi:Sentrin-specific protease 6 [Cichlidogyrus casuarinus]|uniref:Sentrin-specific protease 6 n=1 Tax=Cichlidogyrus casuarinus TaxID=1844966 RepID=A0ABD2Q277_9PLAT